MIISIHEAIPNLFPNVIMAIMNRRLKAVLATLILAATIAAFVYYLTHNPHTFDKLLAVPPLYIAIILGLYAVFTGSLALILLATVRICGVQLKRIDGLLLTMWSSIINFFGPLQSGPAFRAVYLKKIHKISLKDYGLATLLYYGFYALFSIVFMLYGLIDWRLLTVLCLLAPVAGYFALKLPIKIMRQIRNFPLQHIFTLAVATLIQTGLMIFIYLFELRAIDSTISFHQAVVYAGVANLALFVSITPGAIGFREAFLLFSQRLHEIPSETVISAMVIDRAAYVILLGVCFVIAISLHVQKRYTPAKTAA